jgi:hypothetical protein
VLGHRRCLWRLLRYLGLLLLHLRGLLLLLPA